MKTLEERFFEKVNKNGPVPEHRPELGPCWVWVGGIGSHGYGAIGIGSTLILAHHCSYKIHRGEAPFGKELHHICKVRRCVNPNHIVALTKSEHQKEHGRDILCCPQGHPYEGENLVIQNTGCRACRICKNASAKITKARRSDEIKERARLWNKEYNKRKKANETPEQRQKKSEYNKWYREERKKRLGEHLSMPPKT